MVVKQLARPQLFLSTFTMPDPALQAYLASKYLSGPKADAILSRQSSSDGSKKKKRKKQRTDNGGAETGLRLRDEEDAWKAGNDEEDDLSAAQVVEATKERFKKARWANVHEEEGSAPPAEDERVPDEDRPQFADEAGASMDQHTQDRLQENFSGASEAAAMGDKPAETPAAMTSQPKAGLRTREELRAERLAREAAHAAEEAEREAQKAAAKDAQEAHHQTVYRDSSGRRIDLAREAKEREAEERRLEAKERERKDWNVGEVQKKQRREARKRLEEEKETDFARYANDAKMNAILRTTEREDDPALAFLTKKRASGPQKPKYKGPPPPPNRFGIAPGFRWDGVDRSNGFEGRLFTRINERGRRERDARGELTKVHARDPSEADHDCVHIHPRSIRTRGHVD